MVKPFHVLFTLLAVGAICGAIMFVFPKDGVKLSNQVTLKFPSPNHFFDKDTTALLDVDSLLNSYVEPIDSSEIKDSIQAYNIAQRQKLLNLQFGEEQTHLAAFNEALEALQAGKKRTIRILHYGDSQIEGDRITSFLREQFQRKYGGNGPGMLPVMQFIPNMSIRQEQSNNWHRYTVFGKKDTTIPDNDFGLRGIVSRFTPYVADTATAAEIKTAWVTLKPSYLGYSHVKKYQKLKLLYGRCTAPVALTIKIDDQLVYSDTLPASAGYQEFEYVFENGTPKLCEIGFSAIESPDFYALSLEGKSGIIMDNVAMRGSSGTIFNRINRSQLAAQYSRENIHLVLLQFGGNTVPYIDSEDEAKRYGKWFAAQIKTLKSLLPEASFVLIGPSDMNTKQGTEYVTYPFLPAVRNALKEAAFSQNIAYWDVYEVMGGRNSMASWVAANPPLAGKDYIHFTPKGARKIAELFYNALNSDLEVYKVEQKNVQLSIAEADSVITKTYSLETTP